MATQRPAVASAFKDEKDIVAQGILDSKSASTARSPR
jgi:hypothetical protein